MSVDLISGKQCQTRQQVANLGCCLKGCKDPRESIQEKDRVIFSLFCGREHQQKFLSQSKNTPRTLYYTFQTCGFKGCNKFVKINQQGQKLFPGCCKSHSKWLDFRKKPLLARFFSDVSFDAHCKALWPNVGK